MTTRIERLVETVYDFRWNTPNFSRAGGALLIYGMYGMFAAALHQRELMLSMWR